MQHNSAVTHTHKVQQLHAAVGANRVGDGARAVVADVIVVLRNNSNERWRWGIFNETEIILKQTCSTIQRQHIRTRYSSRTLLLMRIASAMARAPLSQMKLSFCEIKQMRGGDGGYSTKLK